MPWLQRGLALSRRKRGLILSVGQTAYADAGWRRVKNAAEAAGFGTAKLGLQPADAVSAILQEADIGIVTTEADLLGKSSTYAAMLEHGLPVFSLDAAEVPPSACAIRTRKQRRLTANDYEFILVSGLDEHVVRRNDYVVMVWVLRVGGNHVEDT